MNLTDRQKEIIINYLLSIKGEAKSIPRNFVVMRTEVDEIINLLRAK
jgi:hypothetical protein